MTETPGLDWSTARPAPPAVYAAGFRFAMRYVSPLLSTGPNAKDVGAAELRALRAAGLAVGLVFESGASRALGGAAAGHADGLTAAARARTVGYPAGCPLFYAVDFGATGAQLAAVADYGRGFTAAAAGWPAGGYGSATVVDHLAGLGGAAGLYWWQTAAWSRRLVNGQWQDYVSPAAHLYQRTVKHWPAFAGTDENVLCRPLPLLGWAAAPPTPATSGDDDMPASIIQNSDTGDMALLAPGLFYVIPSAPYIALYLATGLARGPAPVFVGNTPQWNHLRDVALSCTPTAAGLPAELLSELQVIAGVDARIIDAVAAAHTS